MGTKNGRKNEYLNFQLSSTHGIANKDYVAQFPTRAEFQFPQEEVRNHGKGVARLRTEFRE